MLSIFSKIFKQILSHKLITGIILVLIIGGGYFGYQRLAGNKNAVRYATAAVEKGTLIVSVSGSGQVSASDQVDIKPKVSGDIIDVSVKNGQEVKKGTLLVQVDDRDAQKAVQDAEINLETAKIALDEAQYDLKKTYEESFDKITDIFQDFGVIMPDLQNILFDDVISTYSWNIDIYERYTNYTESDENDIYYKSYHNAKSLYEKNLADYRLVSRFSDENTIESLIEETYQTTKVFSETIQNINKLIQLYEESLKNQNLTINPIIDTYLSNLSTYADKINTHLLDLLSAEQTIQTAPVNIKSKELSLEQKEDALSDAKENLVECSIYAPFDGIIAEVNVKKGDSVSTGTALATIITSEKIAEISLNEVDAANVKVGQKVTLTFDALEDVTITGKVLSVDTLGEVSQGVVSYGVKIGLDTQDDRVKSGMSITADIITDSKQDVLILPNSAVKSQGNSYYVELIETPSETEKQSLTNTSGVVLKETPKIQTVEIGLSDDSYTEIISGLNEGDIVVASTVSSSSSETTTSTRQGNQGFQIMQGLNGGGGPSR
jgi:HlyD family secretion protein